MRCSVCRAFCCTRSCLFCKLTHTTTHSYTYYAVYNMEWNEVALEAVGLPVRCAIRPPLFKDKYKRTVNRCRKMCLANVLIGQLVGWVRHSILLPKGCRTITLVVTIYILWICLWWYPNPVSDPIPTSVFPKLSPYPLHLCTTAGPSSHLLKQSAAKAS
jgi:hypothetical protein